GEVTESGFPVVTEPLTLTIFASQGSYNTAFEDVYILDKYEEMTGIAIEWITVPSSAKTERITLAFSSGDLPDAFLKCGLSASMLQQYGESGDLIDLGPYLEKWAPSFNAYMQQYPDAQAAITTPEGAIYSLPAAADANATRMNKKFFWNQSWLDKLGMTQPTTVDELYAYAKAAMENDANGNGEADEIPLSDSAGNLYYTFGGFFGAGNRGVAHNPEYDSDPQTGAVRHIKTSDAFRQATELMAKWYAEGIIDKEYLTYSDSYSVGLLVQNRLGLYNYTNLAPVPADQVASWVPTTGALTGPNGDTLWPFMRSHLHSVGAYAVTADCENVEAALRWVDYFYTNEGVIFYHYGIEGDTCVRQEDGSYKYADFILDQITGDKGYDEVVGQYTAFPHGSNPTIMSWPGFSGMELTPETIQAADAMYPASPEVVWPIFTYTTEENEIVTTVGSD
ncbi:MAG TPA: extracellular solute-binding protein, partial [Clostridia bacterium]|nr:extracellular solute-binding protein [Clostridia bacterium]